LVTVRKKIYSFVLVGYGKKATGISSFHTLLSSFSYMLYVVCDREWSSVSFSYLRSSNLRVRIQFWSAN